MQRRQQVLSRLERKALARPVLVALRAAAVLATPAAVVVVCSSLCAPEDVVGANGVLDVEYTVRNTTATTTPVTFSDVEGEEITGRKESELRPMRQRMQIVFQDPYTSLNPRKTVGSIIAEIGRAHV